MAVRKIMAGAVRTGDRVLCVGDRFRVVTQVHRVRNADTVRLDLGPGSVRMYSPAVALLSVDRQSRVVDFDAAASVPQVVHRTESASLRKTA